MQTPVCGWEVAKLGSWEVGLGSWAESGSWACFPCAEGGRLLLSERSLGYLRGYWVDFVIYVVLQRIKIRRRHESRLAMSESRKYDLVNRRISR
jgi:hypothetical protein